MLSLSQVHACTCRQGVYYKHAVPSERKDQLFAALVHFNQSNSVSPSLQFIGRGNQTPHKDLPPPVNHWPRLSPSTAVQANR